MFLSDVFKSDKRSAQLPAGCNPGRWLDPGEGGAEVCLAGPGRVLLATRQRLLLVSLTGSESTDLGGVGEAWRLDSAYFWFAFSRARWDAQEDLLRLDFWEVERGSLSFNLPHCPTESFMDQVREGIAQTQVFSAPVELPSGERITVQILRDGDRKIWAVPAVEKLKSPDDRTYLAATLRQWEHRLGLKVTQNTGS